MRGCGGEGPNRPVVEPGEKSFRQMTLFSTEAMKEYFMATLSRDTTAGRSVSNGPLTTNRRTDMNRIAFVFCIMLTAGLAQAQQRGIINNSESPHVKLKSINIGDCQWTEGFWADKFKLCEEVMVPHMGTLLKGDIGHAYNNFKIAAGLKEGEHKGLPWHDGDFYKWMESAMYVYGVNKDERILKELDEIIEVIGKAQKEDGYLHTQIQIQGIKPFSNRRYHEMYNSGHLLTSACIHHRVTGKTNFLNIAIKTRRPPLHVVSATAQGTVSLWFQSDADHGVGGALSHHQGQAISAIGRDLHQHAR